MRKKIIIRAITIILSVLLITFNIFQEWQFEHNMIHFSYMTKKAYWMGFLKTSITGEWWLSLQVTNMERIRRGLPEYYYDSINLHHIREIFDFEEIPKGSDSIYYSSAIASSEKHSYILKGEHEFSPAITVQAAEVVHLDSKETIASVKFYFRDDSLKNKELFFVISFACDTGVYYYKAIDLTTIFPKPGQWNTITTKLELGKIKDEKDNISIYIWSRNPKKEIFIDDLTLESIYPKD